MTNVIELKTGKIEELCSVLKRDLRLVTNAIIDHKISSEDAEAFVNCVKDNYPDEYKNAEAIVFDSQRKIISLYEDEVQHFVKKHEELDLEHQNFQELIHEFLMDNEDVRPRFVEFLKEKKAEQDVGECLWSTEIKWHIVNFSDETE